MLLPISQQIVFAELFAVLTLAKFLVRLGAVPKYSAAACGIAGRYPRIAGSCADNESKKKPKTQSPTLGLA